MSMSNSRRSWSRYFLPALYKYMTTGDYLLSYVDDDIPDAGVRHLVAQVKTFIDRIVADENGIKKHFC